MIRRFPSYPQGINREVGIQVAPYPNDTPSRRPSSMNQKFTRLSADRQLAGSPDGIGDIDSVNSEGIESYPNELDVLAEADDVSGNGVFDPNLTHGNNHPDAGVFADKLSFPGYVAREKFYGPSEVTDITTGDPVEFVPGGAVAFQEGQAETFQDLRDLWATPPNSEWLPRQAAKEDTWVPKELAYPVGSDPLPPKTVTEPSPSAVEPKKSETSPWLYGLIGVGVGVGLFYGYQSMKGGRK